MAAKLRFEYSRLDTDAEGELDTRGRKGTADPVDSLITAAVDDYDVSWRRI